MSGDPADGARAGVDRERFSGARMGGQLHTKVTRTKPPKARGMIPVWGFAAASAVWLTGCYKYLMWSEQSGKDIRRKGIIKDIVREEKRLEACKDCTSDALIQQLQDDGFARKWKAGHLKDLDEDDRK